MPKKPDSTPTAGTQRQQARQQAPGRGAGQAHADGEPRRRLGPQHQDADHDHQQAEQRQELLAVDHLAEGGADQRTADAGGAEGDGAGPADRRAPGMQAEARGSVQRHGERRRADGDVRRGSPTA